ncbi:hypothetical protein [Undibacterium curvum]|uniref:Uncharacterized protein n=1 Tax=Undibacterium curvum TaxID=2762294 RepID=A0ABR7A4U4_9BURK|nr:hypothetical protein [Undibacterium curvum]MBC3931931.1 hypothetical protein [Undibacterium curvum]
MVPSLSLSLALAVRVMLAGAALLSGLAVRLMKGGLLLMTLMIRGELVLVLPALLVALAVLIVFV